MSGLDCFTSVICNLDFLFQARDGCRLVSFTSWIWLLAFRCGH